MGLHGFANTEIALELCLNSVSSMAKNTTTKEPLASSSDSCRRGSGSFFSNASVKRERDVVSEESERLMESNTSGHEDGDQDEGDGGANNRKKLRLTKAQSGLLEEAFKLQPTLNPKQKQNLARDLNLRPRQVEVWFQNRRARTKLKQTEIDCEYLKKCCKTLTDENQRLRQEVQRLRAQKVSQPLYMQLPAATLTMCPSCEQIGDSDINSATTKTSFTKPYFFNTFTSSSAAC